MQKKINTIDLFAGCGGLMEGFEQSGFYRTIACVEWEKAPCDNLVKRLKEKWGYSDAESRVARFDIQRIEELFNGWTNDPDYGTGTGLNELVKDSGEIDLIIGGPPCQAYSVAGRVRDENGMRNDYRNYLFESYIKIVSQYKPKAFVFENVPGMLSACPGDVPIVNLIRQGFSDAGYEIVENLGQNAIIDFTEYGVPQNRKRVIILGVSREVFGDRCQDLLHEFYNDILPSFHADKKVTVNDAIGDLPKFYPADKDYKMAGRRYSHKPNDSYVFNHTPRYHNKRDIQIFKELAMDIKNGNNQYISTDALKNLYTEKTGKTSNVHKYYVLRSDEQSNTIPAHLFKDGLRHIHPDPDQARSITVREAARLQTFSDDYEFIGSMMDQYKMIGNAVPPAFSAQLAKAVYKLLK